MKNLLISFCTMVLLGGCSSPKEFISLPAALQESITSTDVYIEQPQVNMEADIKESNLTRYAGGGLLVAVIDDVIMSHRKECAEEAMTQLQKDFHSFNLREKLEQKINESFKKSEWLHAKKPTYLPALKEEELAEVLARSTSDTVAITKFSYKLNPDFTVLKGTLYLALYPASQKIKNLVSAEDSEKTPIFKFHVSTTEFLAKKGEDIQENATFWAQNNGLHFKEALDSILTHVFLQVDQALRNPSHILEE